MRLQTAGEGTSDKTEGKGKDREEKEMKGKS